eukprot:TRINITY_DN13307_c0_g2_i1.p1 TRINITY_DN13307_c0_g2~~TRINITY_DN13307_c0_g2_i1.p1  ORF type:complete len:232 (-),score=49.25 TRINITY_DN13307_c0_g2_i1:89-784(-)
MQATHYRPDDGGRSAAGRESTKLEDDVIFAERALGERWPLSAADADAADGRQVWRNILHHASSSRLSCLVWSSELVVMLFIVMSIFMEMWGACPYDMGITPTCKYCYSSVFLFWNAGLVLLWFLNLYLFVLLISRGFTMSIWQYWHPDSLFAESKRLGIPQRAVATFLYMTTALLAWLVVGLFALIFSTSCTKRGSIYSLSSPGRSDLMVATTGSALFFVPALLVLGRRFW